MNEERTRGDSRGSFYFFKNGNKSDVILESTKKEMV